MDLLAEARRIVAWEAALGLYSERSVAQGLSVWTAAELTGGARHRLYRARATRVYVLDDHDERVDVDATGEPDSGTPQRP